MKPRSLAVALLVGNFFGCANNSPPPTPTQEQGVHIRTPRAKIDIAPKNPNAKGATVNVETRP
ncbi:MAG TPA: hypothetical protein VN641_00710 [Urbifossiella sp.]|nr:hypothetical protein [Urbifossiella sp.]